MSDNVNKAIELLQNICKEHDLNWKDFDGRNISSIGGWDSMVQLFLVLEVESIIGKELPVGLGSELKTIDDLSDIF